jgi:hypothetical protein
MANAVILPGERLAGLSADLFHKLQAGSLTVDELALFTQRKNPFTTVALASDPDIVRLPDIIRLVLDYGQSPEQMIAGGRYDWKAGIIAAAFPISGAGVVEFDARYFHFNRDISSEKASEEMKKTGWESAKIEHLLCFGEKYPNEQRNFPIVALGSVAEVDGERRVPTIGMYCSDRDLNLHPFDVKWGAWGNVRFLAVRKVSKA